MNYCTIHGRAHRPDEIDDVATLGDDLDCRDETWDNVVEGEVTGSQWEQVTDEAEAFFTVHADQFAYLNTTQAGIVPVKVLTIHADVERYGTADVKVTAGRPGYTRGEVLQVRVPNPWLVARTQVYTRRKQVRVMGPTRFCTDEGDLL